MPDDISASIDRCSRWRTANLESHAKRLDHWVLIHCAPPDGTQILYQNAFTMPDPDEPAFTWVFTALHGHHVFETASVTRCVELARHYEVPL